MSRTTDLFTGLLWGGRNQVTSGRLEALPEVTEIILSPFPTKNRGNQSSGEWDGRTGSADPVSAAPGNSSTCCGAVLASWCCVKCQSRASPQCHTTDTTQGQVAGTLLLGVCPASAGTSAWASARHCLGHCQCAVSWEGRGLSHPAVPGAEQQTSAGWQSQTSAQQPHSGAALVQTREGLEQGQDLCWYAFSSTQGAGKLHSFPCHFHRSKSRTASLDLAQRKFLMIYTGKKIKESVLQTPAGALPAQGADPNLPRSDFKQKKSKHAV